MSDLNCPYCDHWFDDTSDMENYHEDSSHEFECPSCEKIFMASISYSIDYREFETPCLNGCECEYVKTYRSPRVIQGTVLIRCKWCGEEKGLPWEDAERYGFDMQKLKESASKEYLKGREDE